MMGSVMMGSVIMGSVIMGNEDQGGYLADLAMDLAEDVVWHLSRMAQGALDLAVVLAFGTLIYMGQGAAAPVEAVRQDSPAMAFGQTPVSCGLTNDLLPPQYRDCQRRVGPES